MRALLLPGLLLLCSASCIAQPRYSSERFPAPGRIAAGVAAAFAEPQVNVFDDTSSGRAARRTLPRPPAGPKCYACVPS